MSIKIDDKLVETISKMALEKNLTIEQLVNNILSEATKKYEDDNKPLPKPKIIKRPI